MRGDLNRHGMRGGTRKKEEGLAESGRVPPPGATLSDSARRKTCLGWRRAGSFDFAMMRWSEAVTGRFAVGRAPYRTRRTVPRHLVWQSVGILRHVESLRAHLFHPRRIGKEGLMGSRSSGEVAPLSARPLGVEKI
jgi:hypothetical protein